MYLNLWVLRSNQQIEHKMLSSAIEKAQMKIESNNYGIRKNLLEYDQVNNEQREIIYKERRRVLDGENMRESIYKMITDIVDSTVDMCISDDVENDEWDSQRTEQCINSHHTGKTSDKREGRWD